MNEKIKIIFAGTPEFAVPYLTGLLKEMDFEVIGVITQPDKPSGRKQELTSSPVKLLAQKNNLKIWQPENIKNNSILTAELKTIKPDLMVVVAFGQIIPQETLDIAKLGNINIHPSLLPKYRGASPIQSALLTGEKTTGITIMLMDDKMDHGPILVQEKVELDGEETNESLHQKLAGIGVPLMIKTIKEFAAESITPQAQNHEDATFCQQITKDNAKLDWQKTAEEIKRKIYAYYPWPATWTYLDGLRLKIFPPVKIFETEPMAEKIKNGQIKIKDDQLTVKCIDKWLELKKIQLEGKKEMPAEEFLRGYKNINGKTLN
jgi:methionyl-tRNA formyltransferase